MGSPLGGRQGLYCFLQLNPGLSMGTLTSLEFQNLSSCSFSHQFYIT